MRDPFAVVASLGKRLDGTPGAWRDVKAILLVVAREGPQTWNGVAALADALGVSPDLQEQVYREAYHHLAGERTGAATTGSEPPHEQPHLSRQRDDFAGHAPRGRNRSGVGGERRPAANRPVPTHAA